MDLRTVLLVLVVLAWIGVQYGLIVWALRDLGQRPRVRGNNKVGWALLILAVPLAGPLIYAVWGPTSFVRRPPGQRPPRSVLPRPLRPPRRRA